MRQSALAPSPMSGIGKLQRIMPEQASEAKPLNDLFFGGLKLFWGSAMV